MTSQLFASPNAQKVSSYDQTQSIKFSLNPKGSSSVWASKKKELLTNFYKWGD